MKKVLMIVSMVFLLTSCGAIKIDEPVHTPQPVSKTLSASVSKQIGTVDASDKSAKTEDMNKIRECEYDFDSDGRNDKVVLYANAEEEDGDLSWEDFHHWILEIELATGEYFTLFDDSVSHGQLYFEVDEFYTDDVVPAITTFLTTNSSIDIEQYIYDGGKVTVTSLYKTADVSTNGTNQIYSSIPTY